MESAQLNDSHKKKLDVFQRKGLRQILKWKSTFWEKDNDNAALLEAVNARVKAVRDNGKDVIPLSTVYLNRKIQSLVQLLTTKSGTPMQRVTFNINTLKPIFAPVRKQGGPKNAWAVEALEEYWKRIGEGYDWAYVKRTPTQSQSPSSKRIVDLGSGCKRYSLAKTQGKTRVRSILAGYFVI